MPGRRNTRNETSAAEPSETGLNRTGSRTRVWSSIGGECPVIAILGLLLTLAGPVTYLFLLDRPVLRATGLLAFGLMGAGVFVGIVALGHDRRLRVRLAAATNVVLLLVFGTGFFFLARLPDAGAFRRLVRAPDFTLPDHEGRPVSLAAMRARGPVLLVVFRGYW